MNWPLDPVNPKILEDEVHIWMEDIDKHFFNLEVFYESLDLREKKRARRFQDSLDRKRFIVVHGLLRNLLGRVLEIPVEKVIYRYGSHGKPYLANGIEPKALQFNISHSGSVVLIGLCQRRRIGIDIEEIRDNRNFMELADRYFSPREIDAMKKISSEDQILLFYKIWTQKEAFLKGLGRGLSLPLDSFEVPIISEKTESHLPNNQRKGMISNWQIISMKPIRGFIGAVAGEGRDWNLNYHK